MGHNFGGFAKKGKWFKGNLHCHTNRSDGAESPEKTVEYYKQKGHDFLAITDHTSKKGEGPVPEHPALNLTSDSFLVLPGAEYDWPLCETVHLVAVGPGCDIQPTATNAVDFSETLRTWWKAGAFAWWAHPYWSHNSTEDLAKLNFLPAFEVFNNVCELLVGKGSSAVYWDLLLGREKMMLGLATDDTHWLDLEGTGGWVMVKSEALEAESIIGALRQGDFYPSCGPVIEDIYFENEEETKLRIRCSPVKSIKLVSMNGRGAMHRAHAGEAFTDVALPWEWKGRLGENPYLRIEITDREGRSAWTQAARNPSGK